jgi:hypothetical protein
MLSGCELEENSPGSPPTLCFGVSDVKPSDYISIVQYYYYDVISNNVKLTMQIDHWNIKNYYDLQVNIQSPMFL